MELTYWFADFLRSRHLNPIIVELMPNYGRSWSVPEKINHFLDLYEMALVIATPDELQNGTPVPRLDVSYEIGKLSATKKVIFLKEETTKLPTGLSPVFIPYSLRRPQDCLDRLDKELISIFGDAVKIDKPFSKPAPTHKREPVFTLEGKELAPENPLKIQREVKSIFMTKSKQEQRSILEDIFRLLDEENDYKRWVAGILIEEIIEYDSNLIPRETIIKMSEDTFFSVRSAAAVCLYAFSTISPGRVPLDIVRKLAASGEDWYVFTPAIATLQTLSHIMPQALDMLIEMSSSDNLNEAEYVAPSLLKVIKNDPQITSKEKLKKLLNHKSKMVRECAKEMIELIENRFEAPRIIRYSPF
jgi:hypothetical protein